MASFPADDRYPLVPNVCHGEHKTAPALFDLTGKTALVTGGNGGIGGGIARGLAEAGADIIIVQIPGEVSKFQEQLALETGRSVRAYECDLRDSAGIKKTVQDILDDHNVDILVNCAGITGGFVPVLDETDEHRELVVQLHFHAPYVLSQLFARHVAARGTGGKIINISSVTAERAMTRFSVYGPIKAAVGQLTHSLANELAVYNIQVNCLYPGWIHTPLSQNTVDNKELSDRIVSNIPARRWGNPQDFKGVAVFLASSASDYVTGARIWIDGGTHSM